MSDSDQINTIAGNNTEGSKPIDEKLQWPDSPTSIVSLSHGNITEDLNDVEQRIVEAGEAKYHRLGWKRMTIMLIIEAIALGALSIPAAFATLGMVGGVVSCIGIGLLAIYTSYVIGQVKIAYPSVRHYADVGTLMMGRIGYELLTIVFVLQLVFVVGSHCLTGAIAFRHISESGICSVVFGVVSAIILLLLAIPSSFADMAVLGYIDFASIVVAIGITIIATGVKVSNASGGLTVVDWSPWPQGNPTFSEGFIAVNNIIFAYAFATCQLSFMDEMHTPADYTKSIWALGLLEIVIYTITGATIYAFVGSGVQSPALLSAGTMVSRVAFGIALPVIFISGSINTIVACRLLHSRIFHNSVTRYVNTLKGWITWLALISTVTIISWIVAEAIPFFSDLLSISAALFTSGFSFYIPPVMWALLLRKGKWCSRENILPGLLNAFAFVFGVVVLVGGLYSTIQDIRANYRNGAVRGSFSCQA
ncbi:hypothetical protein BBP40_005138 [Aspergillus hancockii]|nr:hypothetical protein BBP40_005138 [Aspergillus hancockii]